MLSPHHRPGASVPTPCSSAAFGSPLSVPEGRLGWLSSAGAPVGVLTGQRAAQVARARPSMHLSGKRGLWKLGVGSGWGVEQPLGPPERGAVTAAVRAGFQDQWRGGVGGGVHTVLLLRQSLGFCVTRSHV